MAQCCGGSRCTCIVTAGPGVTVTGNGSGATPYVIGTKTGGTVTCDQVRPCLAPGDGITYDPRTGTIGARPSTDPGNTLGIGTDGGLLVPPDPPLETGCGLTGDGTADAPLAAAVSTWPFPCEVEANASFVYCDANGVLRTDPRPTARTEQDLVTQTYSNLPVPANPDGDVIAVRTLTFTNTDTCRPAYVIIETEADVDFNLPPNSGAGLWLFGDYMEYFGNTGSGTIFAQHVQVGKTFTLTMAPGEARTQQLDIALGRGTGGATYSRIQSVIRAFILNL